MTLRCTYRWAACLCIALAIPASAEEGKWTPQQLLQFPPEFLRQQGLQLPVSRLWDPARGTGLLAATISTGGCSAGFVTDTGLFLTNHHCLFGIVQEHSRPGRDLITDGFIARSREDELPGKTSRVTVPHKFTDVTREVLAAVPADAADLVRSKAVETKQKALVAACEKTPGMRCSVAIFDGGLQYVLIETIELTDVRLVYAPPRAIGEFGGEPDNFRWPRHTGDFAMGRAYKDGKPYKPEFYFPIAKTGVKPGDFVMVMGYPGRTYRAMTAGEMTNERDFRFKLRDLVYGEWIAALEETTKTNQAGGIAVAATLKTLNNSHTNAQGQVAGFTRGSIIAKQQQQDEAVTAWAARQPAYARALAAKKELDRLAFERRQIATRDFLFQVIASGPLALRQATTLVRLAAERTKPDAERDPTYQARELPALHNNLERQKSSFFLAADQAMLAVWLKHAAKLAPAERIAAIDALKPDVKALYAGTKVIDTAERLKMFEENTAQLKARKDPMLDLAFALEPELRAWQTATQTYEGAVARLRPEWRRAVIAHAGKPVAPDANSTLRVTFAHVRGYVPRDGVQYNPQTTLAGMVEKHTGADPFDVPQFILDAAAKVNAAEIPLDFLADADTTGGNSGSPVINSHGELVGLNFDRVWENVANDFGYNPAVARNVNVDIRFLLWLLKDVQKADWVLKELGR
ncbi:MAG: S46 family peptidase [Candidatus Solibacter sp.]